MNVKIVKKHLKDGYGGSEFNDYVYILEYKTKTLFGKEKWVEFPIMFVEDRILKNFIESAYIFNFEFGKLTRDLIMNDADTEHYKTYRICGNDCCIHFTDIFISDSGYKIFRYCSNIFLTINKWTDKPKWKGKYLSNLYSLYKEDSNTGLSNAIEEKEYKIVEKDG